MRKVKLLVEVDEDFYNSVKGSQGWRAIDLDEYNTAVKAISDGELYQTYEGWDLVYNGYECPNYGYKCPNCKYHSENASPFCPECGADLRGCEE